MRRWLTAATLAVTLSMSPAARGASLGVGPQQAYATPCAAVAAAHPNDEIDIAPGTYTDSCTIATAGLTLRGVGGRPKVDLSATDQPAQHKGIYVIDADDVTVENLELTGAHVSDSDGANGAALRVEAKGLTVRGCFVHDNQDGILGGTTGTITIEYTEFFQNGLGSGCDLGGCTHNVYIANVDTAYVRFNWSHSLATDTANKGHLLKSRAKANYILYNRLTGEDGLDSYEIDLPNGGLAVIVGNEIEKGTASGNPTLVSWGEEGASNPDKRVFVVNNTLVNDFASGTFLNVQGGTLVAHNNLFVGPGTPSNGGSLSVDNLSGIDPLFVDRAHYDDHLMAGSPARGHAVDPGAADQFSLTPVSEYLQPVLSVVRTSAHDVGAFEYGTNTNPADASPGPSETANPEGGPTAGGGVADARAASDDGRVASSGGARDADSTGDASGGCGCRVARAPSPGGGLSRLLGVVAAIALLRRRIQNRVLVVRFTDPR